VTATAPYGRSAQREAGREGNAKKTAQHAERAAQLHRRTAAAQTRPLVHRSPHAPRENSPRAKLAMADAPTPGGSSVGRTGASTRTGDPKRAPGPVDEEMAHSSAPSSRTPSSLVLPGQDVTLLLVGGVDGGADAAAGSGGMKLSGGGVLPRGDGDAALVTRAGVLVCRSGGRAHVLTSTKRYTPAVDDTVVAVVTDRNADFYRLRLHGVTTATLPTLAFDGATKRNKPSLAVGALVYARVVSCSRHMDPELSCMGA